MIDVQHGRFGREVRATRRIEAGELILQGWGEVTPIRTQHTFQFDQDKHVRIPTEIELINHSCEPNCGFVLRKRVPLLEVYAMRVIEAGEELLVDYASFEDEILFLGPCLCGAPTCRGTIAGYSGLPDEQRASYGRYIAEYLIEARELTEA